MIENAKPTTLGGLDSVSRSGETRGRGCEEHLTVLHVACDPAPAFAADDDQCLFHTNDVMIDMMDDTMDEAIEDGFRGGWLAHTPGWMYTWIHAIDRIKDKDRAGQTPVKRLGSEPSLQPVPHYAAHLSPKRWLK